MESFGKGKAETHKALVKKNDGVVFTAKLFMFYNSPLKAKVDLISDKK